MRTPKEWLALLGWIVLANAAGVIGAVANMRAAEFYGTLAQPAWAPPSWVFGPVWTALYVLMGIAAWLVWRQPRSADRGRGLTLFVLQLVANALWSWIFFAWRQGALAFADVVLLWVLVAMTIALFSRVSRAAAGLLLPYLAWTTFAAALTWAIWRLNPGLL